LAFTFTVTFTKRIQHNFQLKHSLATDLEANCAVTVLVEHVKYEVSVRTGIFEQYTQHFSLVKYASVRLEYIY